MSRISGIVVAANESARIADCLACLTPWCDEVIVVDQASEDDTVSIAERFGARVIRSGRMGSADPGRPVGVAAATGDFVLIVDADESVHSRLAARLREIADEGAVDVVWVPRLNVELGHWMRYGHAWPSRKPRFFRVGCVTFRDKLHEGLVVAPGARVVKLPADPGFAIWHFSYPSVERLVETVNRYTTIEAAQRTARQRPPVERPFDLLKGAIAYLWREYLRGGGHRDGMAGLIVGLTRGYYRFLVAAKQWDERRVVPRGERQAALRRKLAAGFPGPSVPAPVAQTRASSQAAPVEAGSSR